MPRWIVWPGLWYWATSAVSSPPRPPTHPLRDAAPTAILMAGALLLFLLFPFSVALGLLDRLGALLARRPGAAAAPRFFSDAQGPSGVLLRGETGIINKYIIYNKYYITYNNIL